MSDGEDIIRTGQAAYLLGVNERVLWEWVRRDSTLPHWKTPGGQLRFSRRKLTEWRDSQSQQSGDRSA
jgi:excisionase family DNA binding protein